MIKTEQWFASDPSISVTYSLHELNEAVNPITITNFGSGALAMLGLTGFEGTINNNFRFKYDSKEEMT